MMNYMNKLLLKAICPSLALMAMVAMVKPSYAAEFDLKAEALTAVMPDGGEITMWGFGLLADPSVSVPGPMLVVPPGDNTLTINLTNNLAVPISIVIPGQTAPLLPVKFIDGQGRQRAESFTNETAPGATETYSWSNLRPGTYIYHSASHPAVQVQMGLYGSVKHDAAADTAYSGNPNINGAYDNEAIFFYSEIDPALHAAVAGGTYGTPAYSSTIDYNPKYFLINGEPFSGDPKNPGTFPITDHPIIVGERVLLRFLNAGLKTHVPTIDAFHMNVIAEDGNMPPYASDQHAVLLSALKTMDAIIVPSAVDAYPVYDHSLHLTNALSSPGGMIAYLSVGDPVAVDDSYSIDEDNTLTVSQPGVLDNDIGGVVLSAIVVSTVSHGTLALAPDGSFVYNPAANYFGPDSFTYQASDGVRNSNIATVSITVNSVNDVPVARNDYGISRRGLPVIINAVGNDVDIDGTVDPATVTVVSSPIRGGTAIANIDGTITYTPRSRFRGLDYFYYTVTDNEGGVSNQARVIVRVLR